MDSVKLAELSFKELNIRREKIENEGRISDKSSFYLYDAKTRRKLDAINWAITYKLQEKKNESSLIEVT